MSCKTQQNRDQSKQTELSQERFAKEFEFERFFKAFEQSQDFWVFLFFFWIFCLIFAYKDNSVCLTENYGGLDINFQTFLFVEGYSSFSLLVFTLIAFIIRRNFSKDSKCIQMFMSIVSSVCFFSIALLILFKVSWFLLYLSFIFKFLNFKNCSNLLIQFIVAYLTSYFLLAMKPKHFKRPKIIAMLNSHEKEKQTQQIQVKQISSQSQLQVEKESISLEGMNEKRHILNYFNDVFILKRSVKYTFLMLYVPCGGMLIAQKDSSTALEGLLRYWLIIDFSISICSFGLSILNRILAMCCSYDKDYVHKVLIYGIFSLLKVGSIFCGMVIFLRSNFSDFTDILLQYQFIYFLLFGNFMLELYLTYYNVKQLKDQK